MGGISVSWESFICGFLGGLVIGETALLIALALFGRRSADVVEEHLPRRQVAAQLRSHRLGQLLDS
jgi:uncharacterized membrane protein YkvI